jgi:hypothetical protein
MRDKVTKYLNVAKWEQMKLSPKVASIKQEVKEASKPKLHNERKSEKRQRLSKLDRDENRENTLQILLQVPPQPITTAPELNLQEYRNSQPN